MNSIGVTPSTGAELMLGALHLKLSSLGSLNSSEKLMAYVAASEEEAQAYGPSPGDSAPIPMPLPEQVKGAILSARI